MDPRNWISPLWISSITPASAAFQSLPSLLGSEMSDHPGVQFMGARTKASYYFQRTHRVMAAENDRSGDEAWQHHFHPHPTENPRPPPTRLPPRRHRDGYDYRRPAALSPADNVVIDLTEDPESPPQENTQSFPGPLHIPHPHRPTLRFPRDLMNRTSPVAEQPHVIDLEAETPSDSVDISSTSGDVLYIGTSTVRRPPPVPRFLDNNGMPMHYRRHTQRPRVFDHGPSRRVLRPVFPTEDDFISIVSSLPGTLNYGVPAFPYNPPSQSAPRGRRSSYRAPSPPGDGFSRHLTANDVGFCPNCQEELGAGEGLKQQIYIAKPCGHVSIVHPWMNISIIETDNCPRPIVVNVLGTEPFQSPKRQRPRPSHSRSARLQVVINLSSPRPPCTTFFYEIYHGHCFHGQLICILVLWPFPFSFR
ncbi:hypothetical protein N7457_004476 [Penicillium paradoxum]|uniref:uncharacterized protein n=1 Tax=Penicillium paradoxum TaxID=176176 RepID=UPI002547EDFF|nr:uncharacterized protein N7457_004476 [Penicillium paradoxum]KAJ5782702.1 hypothetical protein N7457_004476 [Penicillium paradoxum]